MTPLRSDYYKSLSLGKRRQQPRVLVKPTSLQALKQVRAVVFDCDGVLIDTRRSYDATILSVASTLAGNLTGFRLSLRNPGPELILRLRRTGGFNNDWDTTYALILFSVLSLKEERLHRRVAAASSSSGSTMMMMMNETSQKLPRGEERDTLMRLSAIVVRFCASARGVGSAAVDRFVEAGFPRTFNKLAVERSRGFLGYPGSPPQSLMATLFDETYHGPKLFEKMYGFPARYYKDKEGKIEQDKLLVSRETLERLRKALGEAKVAMVTGRPFIATEYSLGQLMSYFDRGASTYIGDADVDPDLAGEYEKFRKPRGGTLIKAKEEFANARILYVGDSEEDQMMVEDARRKRDGFLFGAVCGAAWDEDEQVRYFTSRGADLVMRSVEQVPMALEALRN